MLFGKPLFLDYFKLVSSRRAKWLLYRAEHIVSKEFSDMIFFWYHLVF